MRIASKFTLEEDVGTSGTQEVSFPTPPPFFKEEGITLLHLMNTLSSH